MSVYSIRPPKGIVFIPTKNKSLPPPLVKARVHNPPRPQYAHIIPPTCLNADKHHHRIARLAAENPTTPRPYQVPDYIHISSHLFTLLVQTFNSSAHSINPKPTRTKGNSLITNYMDSPSQKKGSKYNDN